MLVRMKPLVAAISLASLAGLVQADPLAEDAETIYVTATPGQQTQGDLLQATTVLSGEELDRAHASSLGETLANQVGIRNGSYGAAVGRPVIRGLGGSRVKILQAGMTTVDASTVSPDHAVAAHTQRQTN